MSPLLIVAGIVLLAQAAVLVANLRHAARYRPGRARADLPRLSVLVPARNEAENLRRLLPGLLGQDHPAYEVIVVDDGSDDATPAVLAAHARRELRSVRIEGPARGWIGKPHALYVATRVATGRHYLFLDADTELHGPDSLARLATALCELPANRLLTGMPRLAGRGQLLVSQVPAAILSGLPWPLVEPGRRTAFAGVNGQCWMIRADVYHSCEPHASHRAEVLEDVHIGRTLTRLGHAPVLADLRGIVTTHMYDGFGDAWRGFRKNAYLLLGGRPAPFLLFWPAFVGLYVVAPVVWPLLLVPLYAIKATTDRFVAAPPWLTALAPLSYLAAAVLQLDSFVSHLRRRVEWKGRSVPSGNGPAR